MAIDLFDADEIVSRSNVNQRLTDIKGMFPVSISNGGTGETTATGIRTSLGVMSGTSLYYNASGSTGTIELSQSIANFQVIEIFFWIESISTWKNSMRIWNGGDASISVSLTQTCGGSSSGNVRMRIFAGNLDISADSLTRSRNARAYITGTNNSIAEDMTTDVPKIYKIVGYKY